MPFSLRSGSASQPQRQAQPPSQTTEELQARIAQLEAQVTALSTTLFQMHKRLGVGNWGIPFPDLILPPESARAIPPTAAETLAAKRKAAAEAEEAAAMAAASAPPAAGGGPFTYTPLDAAKSEIRILSLMSSETKTDAPIVASLKIVALTEKPKFMPLSYTWGTMSKTASITLNGSPFAVTANLETALKHFRSAAPQALAPAGWPVPRAMVRGKPAPPAVQQWWIDAICINQDDLDERASQVGLMTRLYRMPQVAHVWLGPAGDDSERAMKLVRRFAVKAPQQEQKDFVERKPGQTQVFFGPGTDPEPLPAEPQDESDEEKDRNYRAIVSLFKREWFSRAWILQEAALPVTVKVHCGDDVCDWNDLIKATALLSYVADQYLLPNMQRFDLGSAGRLASPFQRVEQLGRLREAARSMLGSKNPYLGLITALLYVQNAQATDLRDKVYAILPLVSPEDRLLTANYRRSRAEVYTDAARELARTGSDFLSACQYSDAAATLDLPSWVPDFAKPWSYYPMLLTINQKYHRSHREVHGEGPVYDAATSTLKVSGQILDTIASACEHFIGPDASLKDVSRLMGEWQVFFSGHDRDGARRWGSLDDFSHYSGGSAAYWPQYQTAYTNGKGDAFDLSIRQLRRHLVTASTDADFDDSNKLGWYRNFFVGRRMVVTEGRHCGLVPPEAKPGDKLVKFEGSYLTFIIRQRAPQQWILIGDSHFWDNFSDYVIEHMRPEPPMERICLV